MACRSPHRAQMSACAQFNCSYGYSMLSDANVDAPTNASVAFDHFVGLLILTVCVETVGSRLCSSYIYFVSSQYVSDPINSIIFSCALLACETDPATCIPQPRIHGHNPSVAYEFTDPLVARALTCILPTLVPLLLSTHRQLDQCNRR